MIVTYKRLGVHNANGVRLIPGVNVVPSSEWAVARNHPMVQYDIEHGFIVEEQELSEIAALSLTEEAESETNILSAMKVPQAKMMIEETTDLPLLARWKATEKRSQLVGAINRQIELLQAPAEERDRSAPRQISTGKGMIEMEARNPEEF